MPLLKSFTDQYGTIWIRIYHDINDENSGYAEAPLTESGELDLMAFIATTGRDRKNKADIKADIN